MTVPGAAIRPRQVITPVPDNHLRAVVSILFQVTEAVVVVGIRGYVKNIAGAETGKNLLGVYDDAICIITPTTSHTFLGNTDPSRTILERAVLQPGKYRYTRGIHGVTGPIEKRRPAWVQASGVTIRRFDASGVLGPELPQQWIGCNIHDGSVTTTGSAGCQTIVPEQWPTFDSVLEAALKAAAQTQFWYLLTT
jgi:hypothetical protein